MSVGSASGRGSGTEPTAGPLSRASTVAYWFLVIEGLLVVTMAPGLVPLLFLERDASNVLLAALLMLPVGPAASAAFFAWKRFGEERDQAPARHFWRGYRLNLLDSVRVWVPGLVVLGLLATNLTHLGAVHLPVLVGTLSGVVAVLVLVWLTHALVVASVFSFRFRDTVRIAAYVTFDQPRASLGVVSFAVLAAGVVLVTSDWVLVLLASVFTYLVWRGERPVVDEVTRRFVVGAPEAVQGKPWPGLEDVSPED